MATLPGLVKDASPPATDTELSPITIADGTTLLTTKQHNKIVDYLSGDAGPDFIPQNAIDSLVSDLAGKELLVNKVTTIGTPGNDTNYGTEKAIRDALDLKEDSLGFTPENIANKGAVSGYAGLDASQELLLVNFPSGTGLQLLRRDAANTALEFFSIVAADISDFETAVSANTDVTANTAKVTNATHTGDATGDVALTIADDVVTYAKMQNVVADNVILGNVAGAGGIVTELTGAQVNLILPIFTDVLNGIVPLSGGGTTNFLRADGTWVVPASGGQVDSVVGTTNRIDVDSSDPVNPVVDIDSAYVGQSSITTLGTISTGVWEGTAITGTNINAASTDLTDTTNIAYLDVDINLVSNKFQENSVNISPIGLHDIWLDVGAFVPVDSGVIATRLIGTGANQKSIAYVPFLTAVDTYAVAKFKLPRNYDNGTITVIINWTSETEGAGDVEWAVSGVAASDGDDLSSGALDYGSPITVIDTQLTINDSQDTSRTTAITLGNTPSDGDTIYLKIQRSGTSGSDTFGEDAQLLGIYIELITDAAVSA